MKKVCILICFSVFVLGGFSQNYVPSTFDSIPEPEKRNCITIGIMQGGGSMIGVDMEFLLIDKLGAQIGAGIVGFGGGLNYHFKPTLRSSFMSLGYWHQGFEESFTQNAVGLTWVFRGKKWFTFQIGAGIPIEQSDEMEDKYGDSPFMLLYSIGVYHIF